MNLPYVLTGAPSCGKTTVCVELYKAGFTVLPEVARQLIAHNQRSGGPLPWVAGQFEAFQRQIMSRQRAREEAARGLDEIVFSERGMSDGLAYYRASGNADMPMDMQAQMHRHKYGGVFILEPLPYKPDEQRREDPAYARRIHEQMRGAYLATGHEPVFVPVLPINERVKYILDRISPTHAAMYEQMPS